MIASLMTAVLFAVVYNTNGASPTATAHMMVSKMSIADLETSANGYAYNQRGGLPVSYVRYTNHGSGRYYHTPAPVHYVVGGPTPVAPVVSKTASLHEPVLLAYATARHKITTPYVTRQPYARDGFINYGEAQLAKYAQPLGLPNPALHAPYYAPGAFVLSDTGKNIDKRNDDADDKDDKEDDKEDDRDNYDENDNDDKEEDKGHVTVNREKAVDFIATHPIHDLDNPRSNIDVSFELGKKYSAAQNSARGENGDKGYNERVEFDAGEHRRHDKSRQQEHYNTETENKKGHSDTGKNYGRYDEIESGEKGNSYGRASYHKKGQKTSGFHKVYHKDEYKKRTDFYDESHKKGYFDKHVATDEHHNAAEGNFKKGEDHETGSDHENSENEGFYDKGHSQNRDQGYNKEKGGNSFYSDNENYSSDENKHSDTKRRYEKANRR